MNSFCVYCILFIGCCNDPLKSPKAVLKTFCSAYNSGNESLLNECGQVDYILSALYIEKLDANGDPYYVMVKGLNFKIMKIHTGRIGLEKEISKDRILADVIFCSDVDPRYERKVMIYMSQKRSTTSSDARWQVNQLPS